MARSPEEREEIEQRNTAAQLLHNRDAAKRQLTRYRRTLASLIFLAFVGLNNVFWGYFTYPDVDPGKTYTTKEYGADIVKPILHDGLSMGLLVTGYAIVLAALVGIGIYVGRNWPEDFTEDFHVAQLRYDQQLNRM